MRVITKWKSESLQDEGILKNRWNCLRFVRCKSSLYFHLNCHRWLCIWSKQISNHKLSSYVVFCLLTKFLVLLTILKTIINAVKLVILTDSQCSWLTNLQSSPDDFFSIHLYLWFYLFLSLSCITLDVSLFLCCSHCHIFFSLPFLISFAASWQSQRKYALAFGFDNAVASSGESISNEQRFGRTSHCKYLYLPLWRETFSLYLNCE